MNLLSDFFNADNQSGPTWFFRGIILGLIAGIIGALIALIN